MLENEFNAHVIAFTGPIFEGTDDMIRFAIESRVNSDKKKKLIFVLTTSGGYIEVVDRIVDTMRNHYQTVDFIVPNHAYSAGTVLAMSGNSIWMDYYSRLGPIDPQIESKRSGRWVSALGYLERYDELMTKAADPNQELNSAEMALILHGFDQGELAAFRHARKLSIELLKKWLVQYKFKNWKVTETRRIKVTKKMKQDRAVEIAEKLNDTERWHSHGYGISKDVLNKNLKCLIDDLDDEPKKAEAVRSYYELLSDYMTKLSLEGAFHFRGMFHPFLQTREK